MLLRRTGSVEDYTDQFLAFACCNADFTEQQLFYIYTAGVVNPLKTDVALRRPSNLDNAIMLARAYEQRMQLEPADLAPARGGRQQHQASFPAVADKAPQRTAGVVRFLCRVEHGQVLDPVLHAPTVPPLPSRDGPASCRRLMLQLR
jgi:hypothetical protein